MWLGSGICEAVWEIGQGGEPRPLYAAKDQLHDRVQCLGFVKGPWTCTCSSHLDRSGVISALGLSPFQVSG